MTTTLWSRDAELNVDEKYRFVVVDSEAEGTAATPAAHLMPLRIILRSKNKKAGKVRERH